MTKLLSHQQIFDRAVKGVVAQGRLAKMSSGQCHYRMHDTATGRTYACGVGQLIRDDLYTPDMEGEPAQGLFHCLTDEVDESGIHLYFALAGSGVNVDDSRTVEFLQSLQDVHDNSGDVVEFTREAKELAKDFGLRMPKLA